MSEVPDLKSKKRRGVVNTLAVAGKEGTCSELVIILKESPHVKANILDKDLSKMKIKQSLAFADTEVSNRVVIDFAINKIIEEGHT